MPVICENKKARSELFIDEELSAGMKLLGHEAKAVRLQGANIKGAHIRVLQDEAFILNLYIPLYNKAGGIKGYDPERTRKLLLRKNEIHAIIGAQSRKGFVVAPLKLYTEGDLVKLKIIIGRKKKPYDKREELKKKEIEMERRRAVKGLI